MNEAGATANLFSIFDPLRICLEYLDVKDVVALDSAMPKKQRSRFLALYQRLHLPSFDMYRFTSIASLEWLLKHRLKVVHIKCDIVEDKDALFHLIEIDREDLVRLYIDSHLPDIDLNDSIDDSPAQMTALSVACKYTSKKVVSLLLQEYKVKRQTIDDSGCSPIHYAASPRDWPRDDSEIMEMLLLSDTDDENSCIDINLPDPHGRTAGHLACMNNSSRILSVLLINGASLHIRENTQNHSVLHTAIFNADDVWCTSAPPVCVSVCLQHILSTCNDEEIRGILNATCRIDSYPQLYPDTPLYVAVREHKDSCVATLIEQAGEYLELSDDPKDAIGYAPLAFAQEEYERIAALEDKTKKTRLIDGRCVTKSTEEWLEEEEEEEEEGGGGGGGSKDLPYYNCAEFILNKLNAFIKAKKEDAK